MNCPRLAKIISAFSLAILTGCAAMTPSTGWQPKSETEMRQVIGDTVLQALDIYQQYLQSLQDQKLTIPTDPVVERTNECL